MIQWKDLQCEIKRKDNKNAKRTKIPDLYVIIGID